MSVFESYYTEAEEKRLFSTLRRVDDLAAKRDYYVCLLFRETAVRLGVLFGPDARKAERENLPMLGFTLGNARDSLKEEYLVFEAANNKRQKKHPVHLNKSATAALKQLLSLHKQMTRHWDWDLPHDERPLIVGRLRNRGLSRRNFQERFRYWCDQAEVPMGTVHWLRHTWAKRYLERSESPAALRHVQAVLGHANINTTAIYTRPDKEALVNAMQEASTCRK
ncbi:hypothetical protein HMF8227_02337 [Saliniradius amylolyticus]|uniref:Tyr recombinase domain-containing protein n=1 Tax=Saliniradius amylolyticus TaxID=2183582 RepID=A0A2S2E5B8_9ALTE|nr:site-specific integrase [Saliniradius amylolyticus]AWL12789.1 hypothetical protein HMF8227_02337 [Saliniradius amylolyticus]